MQNSVICYYVMERGWLMVH